MNSSIRCDDKQSSTLEVKPGLPASAEEAIRILAQGFMRYFGSRGASPLVPEDMEK